MTPLEKAQFHLELERIQRRIFMLSNDLCATVDILDNEDSEALEWRELNLLNALHQACERRALLRKILGIKPRR